MFLTAENILTGITLFVMVATCPFLLGSIPTGVLLSKLYGTPDLRTIGSGNIGATNAMRTGKKSLALFTLLGDFGKGYLAVWLMIFWFVEPSMFSTAAGIFVILGHCFTPWLNFKGGKGIATGFGVAFALSPWVGLIMAGVWLGVFAISRYSAVAGLATFAVAPIALWFLHYNILWTTTFIIIAIIITFRHRSNICNLLTGKSSQEKR